MSLTFRRFQIIAVLQAWRFQHRIPLLFRLLLLLLFSALHYSGNSYASKNSKRRKNESKCHIFAISTHKTTTETRNGFKPERLEPHPNLHPPTEWADWDPLFWSGLNSAVDGNRLDLKKRLARKTQQCSEFEFTTLMSLQVPNVSKNMQNWLYALQVNLWGRRQEQTDFPEELLSYPLSWQINSLTPHNTLLPSGFPSWPCATSGSWTRILMLWWCWCYWRVWKLLLGWNPVF